MYRRQYVENKRPTGCNRLDFIAKLIVRSICFGHQYVHHQELKSYTDVCCLWYVALWFTGRWVWCGAVSYVSWLRDVAPSNIPQRQDT